MAYGYHPTPEQIKAQQEAREQRIQEKHDQLLEEQPDGGKGGPDRSQIDTPLMNLGIPALRDMIMNADPDRIYEVSQHWKQVHNILSGGDGSGGGVDSVSAKDSVAGMLQTAVDNVLEHWEGEAAQAFQREAAKLSQRVRNGAAWANRNAQMMDAAQKDLRASREKMRDIKEPSGWDRAWDKAFDDERNDARLLEDIKNGASTEAAAKANADSLSLGKQKQLEAVAVMEQLAVNYKAYAATPRVHDSQDPYSPPSPNNIPMPPPIAMPNPSGSGRPGAPGAAPKPWSAGGTSKIGAAPPIPRPQGITGGTPLPPTTGTNVDSIKPGLTGPGLSPGPVGGGGGGGGAGALPGGGIAPIAGPGLSGGGRSGVGGPGRGGIAPAGRSGLGTPGGRAGLGGGPGGAAAGRGTGGRPGMGGMGGMGGGAGAGAAGRGSAAAGGRGALAKARGGVVGAAKAPTGKGTAAGAGLHGSRGGSQRGAMAGGMAGGMGRGNGRRSEEENSRGERPDYLVEDEETWVSEEDRKRNVPRNIE